MQLKLCPEEIAMKTSSTFTLLLASALTAVAHTSAPINYQMRLTDGNGQPMSGSVNVSIGVYTNTFGSSPLYTESVGSQVANNGILSFQFGADSNFPPVLAHPEVYLEVSIDGAPLAPRQRLVAVPYAIQAASVKGSIILENNTDPSPAPGSIRWNGDAFEGYNGSQWTMLTAPNPYFLQTIADQTINEDESTVPLGFEFSDPDTPVDDLTITVTSEPDLADFVVNGTGSNRNLVVTPFTDVTDPLWINVRVSDGDNSKTDKFLLTINSINDRPTISPIGDQVTQSGQSTVPVYFSIGDVETASSNLVVTATSTNLTLMHPTNSFTLGGTDNLRTLILSPLAGQVGTDLITVTVDDGDLTTNEVFTLTVNNTAPIFTSYPSPSQLNLSYSFPNSSASFSYSITTSDEEGHPRTLSAVTKPPELTLSTSGGNGTLSGALSQGNYPVTLKVEDSYGDSTTQSFIIQVDN